MTGCQLGKLCLTEPTFINIVRFIRDMIPLTQAPHILSSDSFSVTFKKAA